MLCRSCRQWEARSADALMGIMERQAMLNPRLAELLVHA